MVHKDMRLETLQTLHKKSIFLYLLGSSFHKAWVALGLALGETEKSGQCDNEAN